MAGEILILNRHNASTANVRSAEIIPFPVAATASAAQPVPAFTYEAPYATLHPKLALGLALAGFSAFLLLAGVAYIAH